MKITKKWLKKENACLEGYDWFIHQEEIEGIKVVEKLIKEKQLDWANWLICKIFDDEQRRKYSVFAALQVNYLWKDKYPKEYKIWKAWVDNGCPEDMRAAAGDAAWAVAGAAAWVAARAAAGAAWAAAGAAARAVAGVAGAAAGDAMLTKTLKYGIGLLEEDTQNDKA